MQTDLLTFPKSRYVIASKNCDESQKIIPPPSLKKLRHRFTKVFVKLSLSLNLSRMCSPGISNYLVVLVDKCPKVDCFFGRLPK